MARLQEVQRLKRRNTHDRTVLSFLWQVKIVAVFPGISMLISVWIGTKIDPEFEEDRMLQSRDVVSCLYVSG